MPRKSHPFWRFSVRLYARSGVEAACLALQEAGADVNLLLFCCWQGSLGCRLGKPVLRQAIRSVAVWQRQVVQALRQARRSSKVSGIPVESGRALSKQVAKLELEAEYLEQLMLAQHAVSEKQPAGASQAEQISAENLLRYLDLLGISATKPIKRQLQVLLAAATGDGPPPLQ